MTLPSDRGGGSGSGQDPADAVIGRLLGDRYRVVDLVARGGMAHVYRARDVRLERDVAVKILAQPYAESPEFTRRFLTEARTAAGLSAPNLIHVYDSGVSEGLHYMVMELLQDYRSLRSVLDERERLPADEAIGIAQELLAGLRVVHDHGLVHADVKVGNVMVGAGPTKLIDFGIARAPRLLEGDGTSLGSLHAMPLEQLRGEPLGPETDLFAVGVVLYQLLTGRVPYPGDDPQQVVERQEQGTPSAPSTIASGIGARLDAVVLQALAADRSVRFSSATALSRALEIAGDSDEEGPPPGVTPVGEQTTRMLTLPPRPADVGGHVPIPRRPRPRRRRSAAPFLVIGALAVVVLAAVVLLGPGLLARDGSATPDGGGTPTPTGAPATPTLPPGRVRVPDTIGMSEADAEAAARQSGLRWEIRWQVVPGTTPGIYDQEPAPGTVVGRGDRFTMYAHRQPD